MIPDITIVVGYSCPLCNNCSLKMGDEFCCKCACKLNWSPYRHGKLPSIHKVKFELLNTMYEKLELVNSGKAVYHNKLSLSIKPGSQEFNNS